MKRLQDKDKTMFLHECPTCQKAQEEPTEEI